MTAEILRWEVKGPVNECFELSRSLLLDSLLKHISARLISFILLGTFAFRRSSAALAAASLASLLGPGPATAESSWYASSSGGGEDERSRL